MLDRILNINPQEKYKNGLKISNNPYVVNRHDQDRQHSRDSALFSPLARLMSQINWKILNIEYPSKEEILLNFIVNGLEFITVINFNEIYTNAYQEFSIFYTTKSKNKKLQLKVKLKVKKDKISILDSSDLIETENIFTLFDRIAEWREYRNTNIVESSILNNLLSNISFSLNREFNYILKVIYTFISTRNKSRVKNNFILKTQKNIPIIMLNVAIINAE